jgi:hypothetical protein
MSWHMLAPAWRPLSFVLNDGLKRGGIKPLKKLEIEKGSVLFLGAIYWERGID